MSHRRTAALQAPKAAAVFGMSHAPCHGARSQTPARPKRPGNGALACPCLVPQQQKRRLASRSPQCAVGPAAARYELHTIVGYPPLHKC